MNNNFRRLAALAIAAAMQGSLLGLALAQGSPQPPSSGGQPPGYGPGGGGQMVQPTPSSEATPGTELPVLYVTSVEVLRTMIEPKLDVVRVTSDADLTVATKKLKQLSIPVTRRR